MATNFTKAQVDSSGVATRDIDPTKKPGRGTLHLRTIRLDFDAIATATGTAVAVNDTYQCFDLTAGDIVLSAGMRPVKVTTAACVGDLGFTSGDVDVLVDGCALNDLSLPAYTRGLLHPIVSNANDTIDFKAISQSPAGGIVDVWVLIARI